ncbi:RNA polymerase, sigma 54 subunit, RpoN/SigL [Granulicatella balaenopterae]|uniref:RNA polymerase, sigma 54 subunit, RpoN/SigL n=1 Tax=Granulicatella balaenopterae TaxID=137733 RepID=A0A1H9LRC0_9LACT|nr:RNA polymerase factor sigma-54 [Granulicatella balaenopterae]SER13878.1 RNA polymerase, sigma 54 subunit, RpoN/SigL [Granulicatella balaenopterae]
MKVQNGFGMQREYRTKLGKLQTNRQKLSLNMQQNLRILQLSHKDLLTYIDEELISNPLMNVEYSLGELMIPLEGLEAFWDSDYTMDTFIDRTSEALQIYLKKQIMCYRATKIRDIMLHLLIYVADNGYLILPSEEELCQECNCSKVELLDALTLMQQLEPTGICARSLRECWLIQIEQDYSAPDLAYVIVESYFEELIKRNFYKIANELAVSTEVISEIVAYYRRLTVNPAYVIMDIREEYIYPDIMITKEEETGEFIIVYNQAQLPVLSFDEGYYQELQKQDDDSLQAYIKQMKSRYQFVFQGLKKREQTLLLVAKAFVELQQDFFESQGQKKMPLTLEEVAKYCDFHLSTISRAIQGKYFYTDFGVFSFSELLFTPNFTNDLSQDVVKKWIKKLIEAEDKNKPLSDQKIAECLGEMDLSVARRTVAKYRVALGYASANKRKIH